MSCCYSCIYVCYVLLNSTYLLAYLLTYLLTDFYGLYAFLSPSRALKESQSMEPNQEQLDPYGTYGRLFKTDVSANFKVT